MSDAPRRKSPRVPRTFTRHIDEEAKTSGRSRSETRERSLPDRKRKSSLSEDVAAKKRALSPAKVPTVQKVGKSYIQGRLVDSYCWLCHKVTNDIFCERCPRRYHEACLVKAKLSTTYCECQNVSVDGRKPMPWASSELKQFLGYAIQEAIKEEKKSNQKSERVESERFQKYFKNWPTMAENDCLHTIVDINVLIDKMNNDPPYLSTGSFFADVKWIYHNCYILYGANHEITKTALALEKNFKLELIDIEACRECYSNKHKERALNANFFIKLCSKPHPIVWAKMRRYPSWPAKCLKIQNGHADIRFFGTHEKANILLNQVFKYSKEHPENKENLVQKFKEAMIETEYYIANYENKYGTFQYFKKKTPLDVGITRKKHHRKECAASGSSSSNGNQSNRKRWRESSPGGIAKKRQCSPCEVICGVCREILGIIAQKGGRIIATKCGHLLCQKCYHQCVLLYDTCPVCRHPCLKSSPMEVRVPKKVGNGKVKMKCVSCWKNLSVVDQTGQHIILSRCGHLFCQDCHRPYKRPCRLCKRSLTSKCLRIFMSAV